MQRAEPQLSLEEVHDERVRVLPPTRLHLCACATAEPGSRAEQLSFTTAEPCSRTEQPSRAAEPGGRAVQPSGTAEPGSLAKQLSFSTAEPCSQAEQLSGLRSAVYSLIKFIHVHIVLCGFIQD